MSFNILTFFVFRNAIFRVVTGLSEILALSLCCSIKRVLYAVGFSVAAVNVWRCFFLDWPYAVTEVDVGIYG